MMPGRLLAALSLVAVSAGCGQDGSGTKPSVEALPGDSGETYVVVLGGALSRLHMSLYGYPRQTTPSLDALFESRDILRFDGAWSNHTDTRRALSLALTEAAQDGLQEPSASADLVDVFRAAGFQTYWLTNRALTEDADDVPSAAARKTDELIAVGDVTGALDGELIDPFRALLEGESTQNRVFFVHLAGVEGADCRRYPEEYDRFSGDLEVGIFGTLAWNTTLRDSINCYDNGVLYHDHVVSELLRASVEASAVAFAYVADHGEDVLGGRGNDALNFDFAMTAIPMFFWLSNDLRAGRPDVAARLESRTSSLFSSDRLYDTLIGLAGITTKRHRAELDLTATAYGLEPGHAVTLHGSVPFTGKANYQYWRRESSRYLDASGQGARVIPHRVDTVGKLKDAWAAGVRGFEVDLVFDYRGDGRFIVGHNDGVMGTDLETFLAAVPAEEVLKIWFDVKNIDAANHEALLLELERVDSTFQLKDRIVLESGWRAPGFKAFRDAGWQTSFYLPTGRILDALAAGDPGLLSSLAVEIAEQLAAQDVRSASFDQRLYPFVKSDLEPLLAPDVTYHAWRGPAFDWDDFETLLSENAVFKDDRVKTLLCGFLSPFNL